MRLRIPSSISGVFVKASIVVGAGLLLFMSYAEDEQNNPLRLGRAADGSLKELTMEEHLREEVVRTRRNLAENLASETYLAIAVVSGGGCGSGCDY
jgi:hypothetical protein